MSVLQTLYPATSSVALTITLASLASDSGLLVGRGSVAVDNTTDLDLDHILSGYITTGTTPTVNKVIEVWAYANWKTVTGTPTYPDNIAGTDVGETLTSRNVVFGGLRLAGSALVVDATSDRGYYLAPVSIATLLGGGPGFMPKFWGIWVVHDTAVALNGTGGNHSLHYERIQQQVT